MFGSSDPRDATGVTQQAFDMVMTPTLGCLLLLLKADMLSQGHQMLLLSSVYSSDEQACAGGWEAAQDGNARKA